MGVKLVGRFPACEEVTYLYKMLIFIRMFRRFTRNNLISVRVSRTLPKRVTYEDQNEPPVSVQEAIYLPDQ